MQNYEKQHVYLMYAIGALVLLPLYILVGPFIFQGILFDDKTVWLLQPSTHTYWLYAFSGLALTVFLFLAYLFGKYSKMFTAIGVVASLLLLALGTFSFQSLSSEKITWSQTGSFHPQEYSWEEVKEVVLVLPRHGEKHKMVFYFNDGNELTLIRDNKFTRELSNFNLARREYNFPYTVDRTNQF